MPNVSKAPLARELEVAFARISSQAADPRRESITRRGAKRRARGNYAKFLILEIEAAPALSTRWTLIGYADLSKAPRAELTGFANGDAPREKRAPRRLVRLRGNDGNQGSQRTIMVKSAQDRKRERDMPYSSNDDLPSSVRTHLPPHAQDIYRAASITLMPRIGTIRDGKRPPITSPGRPSNGPM